MSPKLKVDLVITKMELGGAQQVALETAKLLDPDRFEVRLISGPGGGLEAEARAALGKRFVVLNSLKHPISPAWDAVAVARLAGLFLKRGTDIVHTHSSKAGLVGRLAAVLAGTQAVVHTVHGWSFHDFMPPLQRRLFRALERAAAPFTSAFVAVAESVRDKGLGNGIGRPDQYRVIRAAVDLKAWEETQAEPAKVREGLGLPSDCPMVVSLANCKPQKNPLDFVEVAVRVQRKSPHARFVYVGDGPLRTKAEARAAELGLAGRVLFLGWRADAREIVAASDVFLLTSLWEGLPCVFAQAMALGLPVVATAVDGAAEIVKEGETGYLAQARDVDALADRVSLLLSDPGLRQSLGAKARASLGPEWTLPDMAARTGELYLDLLASVQGRASFRASAGK